MEDNRRDKKDVNFESERCSDVEMSDLDVTRAGDEAAAEAGRQAANKGYGAPRWELYHNYITPGVGARRGAKRLSTPTRRGRSAGERKSENHGKTGKNGVFRRRFEKTRGDTGRNDVRRTRPEATDASAQSTSIRTRRAKS
jgi:hypothetical protein